MLATASMYNLKLQSRISRGQGSRHLLIQSDIKSRTLKLTLAGLVIAAPVLCTAWSFFIIGEGVAAPESDSNEITQFIYNQRHSFTAINDATNSLFTLLFAYSTYLKLIKKENYTQANLLLALIACIPGSVSAANFYPLLENARHSYSQEHNLSEASNTAMFVANMGGVAAAAYINTIACYGIIKSCIEFIQNLRAEGFKTSIQAVFKDRLNAAAIPGAIALGAFYWVQVAQYVADFFTLSFAAALFLCLGDFFFGMFYLYFGSYQLLNGFKHLTLTKPHTSIVTAVSINLTLLAGSLAWDAFNIIPTYSQGAGLAGRIGLVFIAMILNFYASNRMINSFLDLLSLNFKNALASLYLPVKDAQTHGVEASFNTTLPLHSLSTGAAACLFRQLPLSTDPSFTGMTANPIVANQH